MTEQIDPYAPFLDRIAELEAEVKELLDELQFSEAPDKMWTHMARIQFNASFGSARNAVNKPDYWDN